MKTKILWLAMILAAATAASAQKTIRDDASAPTALVTLPDASRWQAGLAYARVARMVTLDGVEWKLRANGIDVLLGFAPVPWFQIYGQAGAAEARLVDAMSDLLSPGGGGLVGARLYLWQLHQGAQATAWRLTLLADGHYAYRSTQEDDEGKLQWSEVLIMLPLDYHLTFARTFRNFYMSEFHSLRIYAGPAYSRIDGTWTLGATERDFREVESAGLVGGADLWLLENLSFGARVEWFRDTTLQLNVRYTF